MSMKVMGFAMIAAVALIGCGQQAPAGGDTFAPVVVHSVQINPLVNNAQIGTDSDFTAIILMSDGSAATGHTVIWSSLHPTIATVDQNGHCTTLLVGAATIKAVLDTDPNIYGTAILNVTPLPPPPCNITTSTMPAGTVGTAYTVQLTHTGGSGPEIWSITAGALPGGLTLNGGNGLISGTPTVAGVFPFTVRLDQGSWTERPLSITINSNTSGGGIRGGGIIGIQPAPAPVADAAAN